MPSEVEVEDRAAGTPRGKECFVDHKISLETSLKEGGARLAPARRRNGGRRQPSEASAAEGLSRAFLDVCKPGRLHLASMRQGRWWWWVFWFCFLSFHLAGLVWAVKTSPPRPPHYRGEAGKPGRERSEWQDSGFGGSSRLLREAGLHGPVTAPLRSSPKIHPF